MLEQSGPSAGVQSNSAGGKPTLFTHNKRLGNTEAQNLMEFDRKFVKKQSSEGRNITKEDDIQAMLRSFGENSSLRHGQNIEPLKNEQS